MREVNRWYFFLGILGVASLLTRSFGALHFTGTEASTFILGKSD